MATSTSISSWTQDRTTPHRAVERLVRKCWGQMQRGEYELCLALRRLHLDNVHRHEGFARFADYADQKFGIPGKLADLFCFLARHLERLPKTREALERGVLTYTKAREFVRIATPETEEEWIEYALGHTNRDLERRSERVRRGTDEDVTKVTSRLTPAQVQATRMAREKMMKVVGASVTKDQLLPALAKKFIESPTLFLGPDPEGGPDGASADGTAADGGELDPSGRDASKAGPYLSINLCPQCTHAWVPTPGENLTVPVEQWVEALANGAEVHNLVADLLCDCEGTKHRRDRCPNARPDAMAAPAVPPTSRYIPAEVRRRVEARDGHRCRRPGCSNPVTMEMSHLKPFRDGTPPTAEFLAQHCATCNDLIETGRLRVEGRAPLERYYLAGDRGAGESGGEFAGWGFDPSPHVGKRGQAHRQGAGEVREGGAAPPRAALAAD